MTYSMQRNGREVAVIHCREIKKDERIESFLHIIADDGKTIGVISSFDELTIKEVGAERRT